MSPSLRVFADPLWRRENLEHIPLLFPFWGVETSPNLKFTRQVFESHTFDTAFYHLVESAADCDVVLLPYRYGIAEQRAPNILHAARVAAAAAGKPLLIDAVGDVDHAIQEPRAIVMRYGGYRFLKRHNDIIIPPYSEDLLEQYCGGTLALRNKRISPIVCFAGWTHMPLYQYARSYVKEMPIRMRGIFDKRYRACRKGVFVRQEVLHVFKKSGAVETSFVERAGYSGNLKTAQGDMHRIRTEFVENALSADIGLDIRGDANASTRLFELLSLGRVPAIIDTERNLPFSDSINYREFSIVIDHTDMRRAPEIIQTWYDALSEELWIDMQKKAREVYVEWFRLDGMTKHLVQEIQQKIQAR